MADPQVDKVQSTTSSRTDVLLDENDAGAGNNTLETNDSNDHNKNVSIMINNVSYDKNSGKLESVTTQAPEEAGGTTGSMLQIPSGKSPKNKSKNKNNQNAIITAYCLVFKRKTKYHECIIEDDKLVIHIRDDLPDSQLRTAKRVLKSLKRRKNLVKHFKQIGFDFVMSYSNDEYKTYIFVIFSIKHHIAEQWAHDHELQIEIDSKVAIQSGRESKDFLLAHRTCIDPNFDEDHFVDERIPSKDMLFKKLSVSTWNHIHISYDKSIKREVYKAHPPNDHRLSDTIYLRILFDMLTEDRSIGGASMNINKLISEKKHPLDSLFALNTYDYSTNEITKPDIGKCAYWCCKSETFWSNNIDNIRNYYGEWVAFYFAYLRHYTKWLYPMAIVGSGWFALQLFYFEAIAIPGSTFIVGLALIWSTLMIETWYRREHWLRFQWGMMKYKATEVPRAGFRGRLDVSLATGEVIETYSSKCGHGCKMICSGSTILFAVACVIAIVFGIWTVKSLFSNRGTEYSVAIGMVNAIQIQILNKLYTYLAIKLNDFEGHRLEQDYYNNLVIKRIFFFIINSFNSLFYIAFYRSYEAEVESGDYSDENEAALIATRTQLITLFLTSIFIQNFFEVIVPCLKGCIKHKCNRSNAKKMDIQADHRIETGRASMHAKNATNEIKTEDAQYLVKNLHVKVKSENIVYSPLEVSDIAYEDINNQIELSSSPDVLDNTAEMVIQYGYIMLFVIVFPIMPLLGLINNFFETRIDFYNLVHGRRPIPFAASGIGVWKFVLSGFSFFAVFSNMLLLVLRTTLIEDFVLNYLSFFGATEENKQIYIVSFFAAVCFLFVIGMSAIRFLISDTSKKTKQAILRQGQCEKYLLLNSIKKKTGRNLLVSKSNREADSSEEEEEEEEAEDGDYAGAEAKQEFEEDEDFEEEDEKEN